jgi:hypothetical protein
MVTSLLKKLDIKLLFLRLKRLIVMHCYALCTDGNVFLHMHQVISQIIVSFLYVSS